jgi:branched-chain amino acid transport system permease protein
MGGEIEGLLVILCLNTIYAYGIFLPAASGQLNLGAAGFITLGAYASAWLNSEEMGLALPMVLSIPGAILFTAAIGFVISFPILRTRGVYMVLATFAFAEVVSGLVINLEFIGAAAGMPAEGHVDFTGLLIITICVVAFCYYFMSTRFGLAMRSVHDDESGATLFGVDVRRSRVAAFTIGAAIVGLGGALYGHHFNYVEAQGFNVLLSIFILLYVLLGGTQTAWGPLVGAAFFTFIPETIRWLGRWIGGEFGKELIEYRLVAFGIIIVVMMVLRPEGFVTRTLLERLFVFRRRAAPAAAE